MTLERKSQSFFDTQVSCQVTNDKRGMDCHSEVKGQGHEASQSSDTKFTIIHKRMAVP